MTIFLLIALCTWALLGALTTIFGFRHALDEFRCLEQRERRKAQAQALLVALLAEGLFAAIAAGAVWLLVTCAGCS